MGQDTKEVRIINNEGIKNKKPTIGHQSTQYAMITMHFLQKQMSSFLKPKP